MNAVHHFNVFADYFQVVLMDETCEDDFSAIWTDDAQGRMLAVGDRTIVIGTLRNVTVPVEVHVVPTKPSIDLARADHVAEASFGIPSGALVVMGCTDYLPDASRLKLPIGSHQALFVARGISSITDEAGPADDLYEVFLWPGPPCEPRLLKHWRDSVSKRP